MKRTLKYLSCIALAAVVVMAGCSRQNKTSENGTDATSQNSSGENEEETIGISEEKATQIVVDNITDRGYYVNFVSDITLQEENYYEFTILSGEDVVGPSIVVHKDSGRIGIIRQDDTIGNISEHPLIGTEEETGVASDELKISEEQATALLSRKTKEELGLDQELTNYTLMVDDITSIIQGHPCYGIQAYSNAQDKLSLVGTYYVSLDGHNLYRFDVDLDDYVDLSE